LLPVLIRKGEDPIPILMRDGGAPVWCSERQGATCLGLHKIADRLQIGIPHFQIISFTNDFVRSVILSENRWYTGWYIGEQKMARPPRLERGTLCLEDREDTPKGLYLRSF
jgi:hypothetical protein